MKKTLITLLCCAQIINISAAKDSTNNPIKIKSFDANIGYYSSHLNAYTVFPLGLKSHVSNKNIDKSTTLVGTGNRTGLNSYLKAEFTILDDRTLGVGYYGLTGLNYSGDLFKIIMQGNSQFAGKTATFNLRMKQISFAKVSYSLKNKNFKDKWQVGIATELYILTKFSKAKTNGNNSLFTSESGLDMEAQLNYNYAPSGGISFKGLGAGVSGLMYRRIKAKALTIRVDNLGLGLVTSQGKEYYQDTTWKYGGVNLSINQGFNAGSFGDSLNSLLFKERASKNQLTLMPVSIDIGLNAEKYKYGMQYIALPGFLPQIYYMRKIYKGKNTIGIGAQVGGWGLANSRIELIHQLKKDEFKKLNFQLIGLESLLLNYPSLSLRMGIQL